MKIAILGLNSIGIETALHFRELGAHVKIFDSKMFSPQDYVSCEFPFVGKWSEVTTSLGRENLNLNVNLDVIPTYEDYYQKYLIPLFLKLSDTFYKGEVDRIHKRFLSSQEKIKNKSRLEDLFRVVINQEPIKEDDENRQQLNELKEKLGKEIIENLKVSIEHYEDFDLVIDCQMSVKFRPMGPSASFAIGEKRLKDSDQVIYGFENVLNKLNLKNSEITQIALIGSGIEAAKTFTYLGTWLENKNTEIKIITDEEIAFSALKESSQPEHYILSKNVNKLLEKDEAKYQTDKLEFDKKINEWKELDDFIRVKLPRPAEPARKIEIYENTNVTVVDKLIDQPRIFLSLESPEFRSFTKLKQEITTLAFDLAIVCCGKEFNDDIYKGIKINSMSLVQEEPGLFIFSKNNLVENLKGLLQIENEILKYFKKA